MIARFDSRLRPLLPSFQSRPASRAALTGRFLIGLLTAVLGIWLGYHWLIRPPWLAQLPVVLAELLRLLELAGLGTVALLWLVLWWWRARRTAVQTAALVTIDDVYALSPPEFERYVAELFRRKGYRVQIRGRSGDLGVDLVLTRRDGRLAIVQCKRYRHTLGPDIVRELYGTLMHERAAHAFLVTTADISESARAWASGKSMTLIDGSTMIQIAAAQDGQEVRKRPPLRLPLRPRHRSTT
jgi:restriction system protein